MRSYYKLRRLGYRIEEIEDQAFDDLGDMSAQALMEEYPKAILFDEIVCDVAAKSFNGEHNEDNESAEWKALYKKFADYPISHLANKLGNTTRSLLDNCLHEIVREIVRDL